MVIKTKTIYAIALAAVFNLAVAQAQEPNPSAANGASVDEQAKLDQLNRSLEQILQQVKALEEENDRLKQEIEKASAENQKLGYQINRMRPGINTASLTAEQTH